MVAVPRNRLVSLALLALACSTNVKTIAGDADGAAGTAGGVAGASGATGGAAGASGATGGAAGTTGGSAGAAGTGAAAGLGGTAGDAGGAIGTAGTGGTGAADGGGGRGGTGGSGGATAPCDPTAPFGMPTIVAELNGPAEELGARLSPDSLTIYFASSSGGQYDIFVATRMSPESAFGSIRPLPNVNSPQGDFAPSISEDGLTLFLETDRRTDIEIMVATRSSVLVDFGMAAPVSGITSSDVLVSERAPFVTSMGRELYLTRRNASDAEIYRATRTSGAFPAPMAVTELNSAGLDSFATPTADGKTVYFASTRAAPMAKGLQDIWIARRSAITQPFGTPALVPELNSADAEYPTWISPDECVLYLHRATPRNEIYVARRPRS
jgi:hypothetical protein